MDRGLTGRNAARVCTTKEQATHATACTSNTSIAKLLSLTSRDSFIALSLLRSKSTTGQVPAPALYMLHAYPTSTTSNFNPLPPCLIQIYSHNDWCLSRLTLPLSHRHAAQKVQRLAQRYAAQRAQRVARERARAPAQVCTKHHGQLHALLHGTKHHGKDQWAASWLQAS
eukprot:1160508-Pelagomonas_calceolata.AAC.5